MVAGIRFESDLDICIAALLHLSNLAPLQSSTGSQATFQRLASETGLTVQKIQADVKAKKQQVRLQKTPKSFGAVLRCLDHVLFRPSLRRWLTCLWATRQVCASTRLHGLQRRCGQRMRWEPDEIREHLLKQPVGGSSGRGSLDHRGDHRVKCGSCRDMERLFSSPLLGAPCTSEHVLHVGHIAYGT
jgi:hypothetical protein